MLLGISGRDVLLLTLLAGSLSAQTLLQNKEFQVWKALPDDSRLQVEKIHGSEVKNNSLNRLSLLSEDQNEYPEPTTGCGPTAMLNILIWYQKYGLIDPVFRDADSFQYKQRTFRYIDTLLYRSAGQRRNETTGSTNGDIALVMDQIVHEHSGGQIRIHTDYAKAPLALETLVETNPNFRSGFIVAYPKHRETGALMMLHAATFIRADREGYITLGTWGETYRGLLRMRDGHQWFIPQNPEHHELRIESFVRFIPFRPTAPEGPLPR